MTRLGVPIPTEVKKIHIDIAKVCQEARYKVIDAAKVTTGRDFLLKIWREVASTPISIGICHEAIPPKTQLNIYYEIGVAQALGKETILIKSPGFEIPSDFIRTEYIEYGRLFKQKFGEYLSSLSAQANYYETIADQLDKDPILAIDYLKRAFLITGNPKLRKKARALLASPGLIDRAKNSVELLAVNF